MKKNKKKAKMKSGIEKTKKQKGKCN